MPPKASIKERLKRVARGYQHMPSMKKKLETFGGTKTQQYATTDWGREESRVKSVPAIKAKEAPAAKAAKKAKPPKKIATYRTPTTDLHKAMRRGKTKPPMPNRAKPPKLEVTHKPRSKKKDK